MEECKALTQKLHIIVAEILEMPLAAINEEEELSAYGISSLSTFILLQKINKELNCNLSLEDLADNFSIMLIAKAILERQ